MERSWIRIKITLREGNAEERLHSARTGGTQPTWRGMAGVSARAVLPSLYGNSLFFPTKAAWMKQCSVHGFSNFHRISWARNDPQGSSKPSSWRCTGQPHVSHPVPEIIFQMLLEPWGHGFDSYTWHKLPHGPPIPKYFLHLLSLILSWSFLGQSCMRVRSSGWGWAGVPQSKNWGQTGWFFSWLFRENLSGARSFKCRR